MEKIDIMELIGGGSFNDRNHFMEPPIGADNGAQASYGDASSLPAGENVRRRISCVSRLFGDASSIRFSQR
ncbi:MAG: hypothetical protein ACJ0F1_04150 [Crocinitomicaceae bacterium]